MEKLYWDTINFNDQKLFFTVNSNGLNFISDSDQGISQIFDFYPKMKFEFKNQSDVTARYVEQFNQFLVGERQRFELPIDVTAVNNDSFQNIWQLIRTVPYGSIMSVHELATKADVDDQTVMAALKQSPLMMIIPVHRIISQGDVVSPVRGGNQMKNQLLEMEAINGLDDIE
ncbi:methylated-DNA--[protein]-cysteine S-methyltransferase [Lactobacillaceae bacterium Scapto_B20]